MSTLSAEGQTYILYGMTCVIIVVSILYYVYLQRLPTSECNRFDNIYGGLSTQITSISPDLAEFKYTLKDYYIKSAYNCCSGGNYRNDFVSLCVLKTLLKQGVRGLDMEIFSINDQPVVATSMSSDYHVKETFNEIAFSTILKTIAMNGFASSTSPNFLDPILLHLRFKSANQAMYKNLARILEEYTNTILLGKEYSYEYGGKNLGDVPLLDLRGKVVVIVDRSDLSFLNCDEFYEYVNMTSSSVYMRALPFKEIKNAVSVTQMIDYNKQNMTIAYPDALSNPPNPSPLVLRETGCQLWAMRYSLNDAYQAENDAFFGENGYAFVLKPDHLRYIPVTIDQPAPQNPELSYATREVSSDYYKFAI